MLTLKKPDGTEISVKIPGLSEDDRKYVNELSAAHPDRQSKHEDSNAEKKPTGEASSSAPTREVALQEVKAQKITLVDGDGKARAILHHSGFIWYDDSGKVPQAVLHVEKDNTAILLCNGTAKPQIGLKLTKGGPVLLLWDGNGEVRTGLGVSKAGPFLVLYGTNRQILCTLPVNVVQEEGVGRERPAEEPVEKPAEKK